MLLPEFGEVGQRRLREARVLVVGCGALGSAIAQLLCRAGVGRLIIVDRDVVEWTNLPRQILFDESDAEAELPKAQAARTKLAAINRDVTIDAHAVDFNPVNAEPLAAGCDAIADGTDNFETRFLINDVAVKHGIPYAYGGVVGTEGTAMTVLPTTPRGDRPWEAAGRATPCLRCIFDASPPPGSAATCDTAGVLGPAVTMIASHQATEVLKALLGRYARIEPRLWAADLWENTSRFLDVANVRREGGCACCDQRRFEHLAGGRRSMTTSLCGRDAVQVTPPRGDGDRTGLEQVAERLARHGGTKHSAGMVRARLTDAGEAIQLTVFPDGRAIVKGTGDEQRARAIYARYVGL
jgi:adenylyltransferase/sulfurtransferase